MWGDKERVLREFNLPHQEGYKLGSLNTTTEHKPSMFPLNATKRKRDNVS